MSTFLRVCILGSPDEAAIFKLSHVDISGSGELGHRHTDEVLRSNWIDRTKLPQLIDLRGEFAHPRPPQYLECLRALAAAAEAYKLMPGATISTDLFSAPLTNALWMPGQYTEKSSAKLSMGDADELADGRNSLMFESAGSEAIVQG